MGSKREEVIPSMKRRHTQHDYNDRGIYMITMSTEGRQPLFGTLAGDSSATDGPNKAHVVLSPLGERVKECWMNIPKYHPQIEVMRLCVMPDHIHGVLFVHEKMPHHLGQVISGFKAGTHKAARELGIILSAMPKGTEPNTTSPSSAPSLSEGAAPSISAGTAPSISEGAAPSISEGAAPSISEGAAPSPASIACAAASSQRSPHYDRHHGLLWEPGYNDRILQGRGQLQRMFAYLEDNPRRLLLKRQHPEFFTRLGTISLPGLPPLQAMGNGFLLRNPIKLQVQCTRSLTPQEIEQTKAAFIARATDQGAILVSPCISPGESETATAAMANGIPLIVLLLNGFPPHFKPKPKYLEACAEGRLLMLTPFSYQTTKINNMRQRCLYLNNLAARICSND